MQSNSIAPISKATSLTTESRISTTRLKLAERSGVLVLTAHYGNFELLPLAHSIYGYPLAMVHRPLRNPIIDERIRMVRSSFGAEIIERKQAGLSVVKYLRQKYHVAAALDLDVRNGVFVDFFGTKACTSDALARIAKATRAPVAPAFMVREGESARHRITVLPVIEMASTGDREEDVRENTQRMTAAIEMMVRRHPEHWNWIHRRGKHGPRERSVSTDGSRDPKPRAGFGLPVGRTFKKDARFALLAKDVRRAGPRVARSGRSRCAAAPRRSEAEPRDLLKEMHTRRASTMIAEWTKSAYRNRPISESSDQADTAQPSISIEPPRVYVAACGTLCDIFLVGAPFQSA